MSKKWFEAFVTAGDNFVLLDGSGEMRATAFDLDGIVEARKHFGWGTIHKYNFEKNIIKIGKEIK